MWASLGVWVFFFFFADNETFFATLPLGSTFVLCLSLLKEGCKVTDTFVSLLKKGCEVTDTFVSLFKKGCKITDTFVSLLKKGCKVTDTFE